MIRSGSLGKAVLGQSAGAEVSLAGNIDAKIAIINLTPSSTGIEASVDSGIAVVNFLPSASETLVLPIVYTDSLTNVVVISPSGSEIQPLTYIDTSSNIIVLTALGFDEKQSIPIGRIIPPRSGAHYVAFVLGDIERDIQVFAENHSNHRPTLPIYDSSAFPQDAVDGQAAISTDGSFWIYKGTWDKIAGP